MSEQDIFESSAEICELEPLSGERDAELRDEYGFENAPDLPDELFE